MAYAGRPHASRFAPTNRDGAEAAAKLIGMHILVAEGNDAQAAAAQLPAGRLFGSGRAFVPLVKAELYDRLIALGGIANAPRPPRAPKSASEGRQAAMCSPIRQNALAAGGGPAGASGGGSGGGSGDGRDKAPVASGEKRPTTWSEIGIGSLVLVCGGLMDGWFEAVVVHTKADDAFELRWRDWPDEPLETRKRGDLALMPLNSREGMA